MFDVIDAVQNNRQREAATLLKDLLNPSGGPDSQIHIGKRNSKATGLEVLGAFDKTGLQHCWRLPFRGMSYQIYAILREEFALTDSFHCVLHRLDVSLSEHPKQARKLAEERKILRSKGTNDIRAWLKSSDDLLQKSFAERAHAVSSRAPLVESLEERTEVATSAFGAPNADDDKFGTTRNDSDHRDTLTSHGAEYEIVPFRQTDRSESSDDMCGHQDPVYVQHTLQDDFDDREPLHHNTNRQSHELITLHNSQLCALPFENSQSRDWRHGAGRKKSWKSCPPRKLPTRRKDKGFREPLFPIDEQFSPVLASNAESPFPSKSLSRIGNSIAQDSAKGVRPAQYAGVKQHAHQNRQRLRATRSARKHSVWTWNRSSSVLDDDLDDFMPTGRVLVMNWFLKELQSLLDFDLEDFMQTGRVPVMHWYPKELESVLDDDPDGFMPTGRVPVIHRYTRELESTKIIIQRTKIARRHKRSRNSKLPMALPKPIIVEPRLPSSSTREVPELRPIKKGLFAQEKNSFESLLLDIPESLPGSSTKKQKRRGVNKMKIPEFGNSQQLFSFTQRSWQSLLERMAEMKDSLPHCWQGTSESYSRRRRTFQAWKKQLEGLELIYPLAVDLERRYRRADRLVKKEISNLEMYATLVDQSQSALMDISWTMRKHPEATVSISGPLIDPSEYSELLRCGIISYPDDFAFRFEHWAIQGISIVMRVTRSYRDWCQMSEGRIKSLLNGGGSITT